MVSVRQVEHAGRAARLAIDARPDAARVRAPLLGNRKVLGLGHRPFPAHRWRDFYKTPRLLSSTAASGNDGKSRPAIRHWERIIKPLRASQQVLGKVAGFLHATLASRRRCLLATTLTPSCLSPASRQMREEEEIGGQESNASIPSSNSTGKGYAEGLRRVPSSPSRRLGQRQQRRRRRDRRASCGRQRRRRSSGRA